MRKVRVAALAIVAVTVFGQMARAEHDLVTSFSNRDTVANTRHNMTQRQPGGGGPAGYYMDLVRNDYREVCVYCHTPHGANAGISAPLWNHTVRSGTVYQTYSSASLTGTVSQPGGNSLACLSCHDGTTAIDSIINMPGSGRYLAAQATSQDNNFLTNAWPYKGDSNKKPGVNGHQALASPGCLGCHNATGFEIGATDFTAAAIGTDLRNDHPVGVALPVNVDWKVPDQTQGTALYFDGNGNGRMEKDEVRFYNSGDGPKVECASCHDPHGVPSGGAGSSFNPTFLRVTNAGSALCLTCHTK